MPTSNPDMLAWNRFQAVWPEYQSQCKKRYASPYAPHNAEWVSLQNRPANDDFPPDCWVCLSTKLPATLDVCKSRLLDSSKYSQLEPSATGIVELTTDFVDCQRFKVSYETVTRVGKKSTVASWWCDCIASSVDISFTQTVILRRSTNPSEHILSGRTQLRSEASEPQQLGVFGEFLLLLNSMDDLSTTQCTLGRCLRIPGTHQHTIANLAAQTNHCHDFLRRIQTHFQKISVVGENSK